MNGFDAIAAVDIADTEDALVYLPISRILAGGFSTGRPAVVAALGLDLLWDNGDFIVWDNDDNIGWEG